MTFSASMSVRISPRIRPPFSTMLPPVTVGVALVSGACSPGYVLRASWEEAVALVADRFRAVAAEHGPEAILPYSYAGSMGVVQRHKVGDSLPWHQDEAYWDTAFAYRALGVWVPLDPATVADDVWMRPWLSVTGTR